MEVNFDHLASLTPTEFEFERAKLLQAHILSLPEDQRRKAYALQIELDLKREELGTEGFIGHCFARIGENMENLGDSFMHIKHLIEPAPAIKPPSER